MDYKLFTEYITLQALLKEVGIIQSGGAIKSFLAEYSVFVNGEIETRRGKKLRIEDKIFLPEQEISITLVQPSTDEISVYEQEKAEKERVATLIKKMNQEQEKNSTKIKHPKTGVYRKVENKKANHKNRKAVRFPGT